MSKFIEDVIKAYERNKLMPIWTYGRMMIKEDNRLYCDGIQAYCIDRVGGFSTEDFNQRHCFTEEEQLKILNFGVNGTIATIFKNLDVVTAFHDGFSSQCGVHIWSVGKEALKKYHRMKLGNLCSKAMWIWLLQYKDLANFAKYYKNHELLSDNDMKMTLKGINVVENLLAHPWW